MVQPALEREAFSTEQLFYFKSDSFAPSAVSPSDAPREVAGAL